MDKKQLAILTNELKQFTGSESYYKNPLFRGYVYTEGVQYLADRVGAYWLIDYILSYQLDPKLVEQPFQVWKMVVQDGNATVTIEDGNDNNIGRLTIEFTDFPLPELTLWLVNKTLLLPSEY